MAILLPLFPSQEIVTINELINESTDAVPDSAVTEPKPGGTRATQLLSAHLDTGG